MRNLAEVVDFHAVAYDGGLHLGLVDGGTGSDLHIVADNHIADVLDLLPGAVRLRRISESVRADHSV